MRLLCLSFARLYHAAATGRENFTANVNNSVKLIFLPRQCMNPVRGSEDQLLWLMLLKILKPDIAEVSSL